MLNGALDLLLHALTDLLHLLVTVDMESAVGEEQLRRTFDEEKDFALLILIDCGHLLLGG
jgi:hypothetical protein